MLAVVDLDARERVGRHRVMVRPGRSRVGAFRTDLTGITNAKAVVAQAPGLRGRPGMARAPRPAGRGVWPVP
ncbi:hypothetical protein [Streptomyces sp. NPDC017230]|uniref:hypothetical protein n=1 Tax=unclassified Streptomyces TaxID=2593676 RepID=UPI0037B9C89A